MAIYTDTVPGLAQFENVNELRLYPFANGELLIDKSGRELSRDIIVDVHISVPAKGSTEVKLTSVYLSQTMLSVCFKAISGSSMCALSVIVSKESFQPYLPYRMEKLYGSEDIGGVVTFGEIKFPGFPDTYLMDVKVHPCCIISSKPSGLRHIVDPRSGEKLAGDVEIEFSDHVVASKNGKVFSLSLEDDAESGLSSDPCNMVAGEQCGATPIRTINGVRPDEDGNIVLWFH